jgi:phage virion morphogenesis protein
LFVVAGEAVQIDTREVQALLAKLADIAQDDQVETALAAIGQLVVTETDLGFREERDPWGRAWQPLSEFTLEQRRKGDGVVRILRDTGNLANSINYQVSAGSVSVGTGVSYASTHQFGEGGIPRRAFLPLDPYGAPDIPADLNAGLVGILTTYLDDVLRDA